jgi:hypothetical protein
MGIPFVRCVTVFKRRTYLGHVSLDQYLSMVYTLTVSSSTCLTFKNRALYIQDESTATLQILHFIYFFNNYKY